MDPKLCRLQLWRRSCAAKDHSPWMAAGAPGGRSEVMENPKLRSQKSVSLGDKIGKIGNNDGNLGNMEENGGKFGKRLGKRWKNGGTLGETIREKARNKLGKIWKRIGKNCFSLGIDPSHCQTVNRLVVAMPQELTAQTQLNASEVGTRVVLWTMIDL